MSALRISENALDSLERRIDAFEDAGYGPGSEAYQMALAYTAGRRGYGPEDCARLDEAYSQRLVARYATSDTAESVQADAEVPG